MPKKRSPGDGGLYRIRGGRLWRATLTYGHDPETGKPLIWQATAATQKAAREKQDEARRQITQHGAPLDRTTRVSEWAARWLTDFTKPRVDPKTFAGYRTAVTRRIIPIIGHKRVSALRPSDVHAVMNAAAKSVSASKVAETRIVLSAMLEDARRERLCTENVARDVKPPRLPKSSRGAFTTEQALAIIEAALALPQHQGSRHLFKLLAGPRQGEVTGATIDNLDLDAGLYTLEWKLEELAREHGCGGTCGKKRGAACPQSRWRIPTGFEMRHLEGRFALTRPKSGATRFVPIIPQLAAEMRDYLAATADIPNPHGLIWRHDDGSPISPSEDAQDWRDLLHAAGIITADQLQPGGTTLTGHWARHTTITVLASLGVDFQLIGEIVGHSTAEVTRIYRHAQQTERLEAMEKLGRVFAAALPEITA